ncbi:Hypothetical protein CCH01_014550 [Clostridium chauvoei JF4335]|nr:Hypothetical protein CCH01_014550 [Clostridium chauvoei JF4335]
MINIKCIQGGVFMCNLNNKVIEIKDLKMSYGSKKMY